jgi:hypothetical protein
MVKRCAFREHGCKGKLSDKTVFVQPNQHIIIRGKDGVLTSHSSSQFAEVSGVLKVCRNCSRSQTTLRKEYSLSQAEAEALQTRSGARLVSLPPVPANKRSRNEAELLLQGQGHLQDSGALPLKRRTTASDSATSRSKPAYIEHVHDDPYVENVEHGVDVAHDRLPKLRILSSEECQKETSADDIVNPIEPANKFTGTATKNNTYLRPAEKDKKLQNQANTLKKERIKLAREQKCNKNLKEEIAQLKVCIYIINICTIYIYIYIY